MNVARCKETPRGMLELRARRECSVAYTRAGAVARTVMEDISGTYEVVSPGHLYCRSRGIDVYPTLEQTQAAKTGHEIIFGLGQWQ